MLVLQLQELDGPFDVGKGTPAEFQVELGVLARRDPFPLDPGLHLPDLADVVDGERRVPDERRHDLLEAAAHLGIAGDHAAAEKRLAFPELGPPLVVALVGGHAAGKGALAAFGSQVGVGRPQPGGRACLRSGSA